MNDRSPSTSEPAVDALLVSIREAIVGVTGSSLVGLYLFGSLASGDFDAGVSDIDLLAVLADRPSQRLATRLNRMHADLAQANPAWDDRTFHLVQAGPDWILNWYPARQNGVRLLGPPIDSLIPPIPSAEYLDQVRRSLVGFTNRIPDDASPGSQAHAILTMCRGLYAIRFGERLSKRAAASWAQQEFPPWADLIRRALGWRQQQWDPDGHDGAAVVAETRSFVAEMAELALGCCRYPRRGKLVSAYARRRCWFRRKTTALPGGSPPPLDRTCKVPSPARANAGGNGGATATTPPPTTITSRGSSNKHRPACTTAG